MDLFSNLKSYLPYGIIAYLLLGGSGTPQTVEFDQAAFTQGVALIEPKTTLNSNTVANDYMQALPAGVRNLKVPAAPSIPHNSAGDLLRKIINYPSKLFNDNTEYGY